LATPENFKSMEKLAEQTEWLVRLQAVEVERSRLTAALKALPAETTTAENLLKAAEKRVADASAGLKREELLRARLELEVAGHQSKMARHRVQMDSATNAAQASALEHEIGFAEKEIQRLEDDELTSMENTEVLENDLAKARELTAKLTETVALIRARVAEQDREFREQLAALKAEREVLRPQIAAEDEGVRLTHFDRIAGMRGTGLARAAGQQCSGCRMGIRPQVWNQLRDGMVLNCESCSRILYYDPAMEPAAVPAKTAQSVNASLSGNLGGNSIKRSQSGV
jgi:predicted  nucleic acid-binding Zn-ribbon protein